MKKIKNLFFIINILITNMSILTVYAHEFTEERLQHLINYLNTTVHPWEIDGELTQEIEINEAFLQKYLVQFQFNQLEQDIIAFKSNPNEYFVYVQTIINKLKGEDHSDLENSIEYLIDRLSAYARMVFQRKEMIANHQEIINKLRSQTNELDDQRAALKDNPSISIDIESVENITQEVNQILEKLFNDIQPLTYDQIQERLNTLYNSGEDGMPLAIEYSEIVAFLQQIQQSQEAGLIHISKLVDPKNPERFSQFVIARSSIPSAEKFILPFSF